MSNADARCPGCGAPTQVVHPVVGYGFFRHYENAPQWCAACLSAKVRAARDSGPCSCDDPSHDHG